MSAVALRSLDPTPKRPAAPLAAPTHRLTVHVEVRTAHLANPHLAVARLLGSEAEAFAHVTGDDEHLVVELALADDADATRRDAEAWVRWAVHHAGIRGAVRVEPRV